MAALAIGPIQSAPSVGTLAPPWLRPPGPSIDAGPDSRGFQAISPKANTTRRGWAVPSQDVPSATAATNSAKLGGPLRLATRYLWPTASATLLPTESFPSARALTRSGTASLAGTDLPDRHGSRLAGFQPLIADRLDQVGNAAIPHLPNHADTASGRDRSSSELVRSPATPRPSCSGYRVASNNRRPVRRTSAGGRPSYRGRWRKKVGHRSGRTCQPRLGRGPRVLDLASSHTAVRAAALRGRFAPTPLRPLPPRVRPHSWRCPAAARPPRTEEASASISFLLAPVAETGIPRATQMHRGREA